LREEHPQVEWSGLLLTGNVIAEVPDLVTDLSDGVLSHRFRHDDSVWGARVLIFCNPGSVFRRSNEHAERRIEDVNVDFHFDDLLDNLPTSPVAFIHAGFNHMKTLRRATPNG
jgi:hypothetical protein